MAKYFTFKEMVRSATADRYKINNTPTNIEIIENIIYTMDRLDELRSLYGKPIYVTSGYRCDALNKAVGGVKDSYHLKGLAADLRFDSSLWEWLKNNPMYDKCLLEKSKDTQWIHIQFKRDRSEERNKIIYMNV